MCGLGNSLYSSLTQYVPKRNGGCLRNAQIRGYIENAITSDIGIYPSTQTSKVLSNSRYRPPMRRFTASTPGRETQRFHMHLLMFLLLQQLQPHHQPPHTHPQRNPQGGGGCRRRPPPFVEAARSAASFMDGCGEAVEAAEAAEPAIARISHDFP